jgi:hypothetical protein
VKRGNLFRRAFTRAYLFKRIHLFFKLLFKPIDVLP